MYDRTKDPRVREVAEKEVKKLRDAAGGGSVSGNSSTCVTLFVGS